MTFQDVLNAYKAGDFDLNAAEQALRSTLDEELATATIDHDREARTGAPEVIFGQFKTPDQITEAFLAIARRGSNVLATRVSKEAATQLRKHIEADYSEIGRVATHKSKTTPTLGTQIGVITAGTSDLATAEEAALTAEFFNSPVLRINDVGVAGIHRLLNRIDEIRKCRVLIVIAGMEGALPSVIGGLVKVPVIAVPTSIGYGAAFGGIAALLGMLTSCASGIGVVNIDNGFGAAMLAHRINSL